MATPLSWIEISRSALLHNWEHFRAQAEGCALLPVLKANAYGHGLPLVGEILAAAGQQWFGLHTAEEAMELAARANPTDPKLLVLSHVHPEQLAELAAAGGRITLIDLEGLDEAAATGVAIPVHLKLETGVQHQGFRDDELEALATKLLANPQLAVEGAHTHYANIEDTTDHSYARGQMQRFTDMRERLSALGLKPAMAHASCSAASILFPETHHDMLRVGISLYGHWPSRETQVSAQAAGRNRIGLRPALGWKARIIQVKLVPAGSHVGYGCSWKTETDTRLGVLPIGYFDGYDRGLGSAHVLVRGRRAPVRGRVMMNLTLVDLTHIPEAARGDEVVLIGSQGEETVSAEMLADWAGTINYEILARLGGHLPRIAVD
ncbi:MAG: alanine racemase [bacterium]|nr:alanine racemase [bacterium]